MDVKLLGVPLDLGANRRGTDMGPSALRVANVARELRDLGHHVEDLGNLFTPPAETREVKHEGLRYLEEVVQVCDNLARRVSKVLEGDAFPLVIGGDHSLAMGTLGGLARDGSTVGALWIDAHADFNTDETSPSGNIHGMPLAASTGRGHPDLVGVGGVHPKVEEEHAVIVGLRSVDALEATALQESDVTVFTMQDIDSQGMGAVMEQALEVAGEGVDRLHVSLDIDSVDPTRAPGVGTPVQGGLTYREAHLAMELVAEHPRFTSLDVVEVNPLIDERNRTALLAAGLIASAMGKRIL